MRNTDKPSVRGNRHSDLHQSRNQENKMCKALSNKFLEPDTGAERHLTNQFGEGVQIHGRTERGRESDPDAGLFPKGRFPILCAGVLRRRQLV